MKATGKDKSVRVRFPLSLLTKLDESAESEGRSRNTQILQLLRKGLGIRTRNKPAK